MPTMQKKKKEKKENNITEQKTHPENLLEKQRRKQRSC